jgi:GxxExxY protein
MIFQEELTRNILAAAIEVHRTLGPGLLESSYEECLCYELSLRGISFERQKSLPVVYKGVKLSCGYRMDIVVENRVILEIKSIEGITEIHKAQLLTYMKLANLGVGLILNFSARLLKDGLVRLVL